MNNHKHKLLLLNPPSVKPVFRDCYCSGTSKGTFFIHPLDLQIQSGFFSQTEFELEFIDAVCERLSPAKTLGKIGKFAPDTILSLVGETFLEDDAAFFSQLKSAFPPVRLFLSGDTAKFSPEKLFRKVPEAEGLLTDFSSPGLLEHLTDRSSANLLISTPAPLPPTSKSVEYPNPPTDFIQKYPYQLPFFNDPRYYSIIASFGCPYQCRYCNTHLIGYRTRKIEHFMEELHFASASGFKSLYVRDATFMVDKERTLRLFEEWKKTGLHFQWICFTRPDLIDEELVAKASSVGCCLMMLGVESFDEDCLKNNMSRSISLTSIRNAFRLLRKYGIRSAAQMMIGMRRNFQNISDYEENLRRFLRNIDPDYISLSVFFRRPGIEAVDPIFTHIESNEKLYKTLAARINRFFYFHPRTLGRQIHLVRTPKQFALLFKIAAGLIMRR